MTSKRLCLDGMPAIVTGDSPTYLRVRLYPPTSNATVVIWAKFSEVNPAEWQRNVRAKLYHHGHKIKVNERLP